MPVHSLLPIKIGGVEARDAMGTEILSVRLTPQRSAGKITIYRNICFAPGECALFVEPAKDASKHE